MGKRWGREQREGIGDGKGARREEEGYSFNKQKVEENVFHFSFF